MTEPAPRPERAQEIVRTVVSRIEEDERAALLSWAKRLLEIRSGDLPAVRKGRLALKATAQADVAKPLVFALARQGRELGIQTRDVLWTERGWAARVGLAGVTLGATAFGGQGAGIAALGSAVGVPLWLVLGAGGTALGAIIEELTTEPTPTTTYTVVEGRKVEQNEADETTD